jgi:hypothetical protein
MLHCSLLRDLARLFLFNVEVDLPALACIRHQLRRVTMANCLLSSSCAPAAGTHAFASGWDELEDLDLTGARIDTHILSVDMPSLQQLKIKGFSIRNAAREALYGSVQAFALGCPSATYVEFEPRLGVAPGPYNMMFAALEHLQLALNPDSSREGDVDWDKLLEVPPTLTTLECVSPFELEDDDPEMDEHMCIRLHAGLSAAAACIKAGAPLQSLALARCNTLELVHVDDDGDGDVGMEWGHLVEPDEEDVVDLYRSLATALHGLVSLDLSAAAGCGEAAVNEVVASAPSLESLMLRIKEPLVVHTRVLVCSGLQELYLQYSVWPERKGASFHFTLSLEDSAALRSCTLEVLDYKSEVQQGDSITLVVRCHEKAGIAEVVHQAPDCWLLGLEVRLPEGAGGSGQNLATMSFVYDEDEDDWASALEVEEMDMLVGQ